MIYFLKIIASLLLPPGIFIVGLIGITLYLWRKNKVVAKLLLMITVLLYLSSMPYLSNALISSLEWRYTPPQKVEGDVIIMLSGGATLDTPNVDGLGHLNGGAANRLLTVARLAQDNDLPIIISGGQVYEDSGSEAQIGKKILLGLGIEEQRITIEDNSLNTDQNAVLTKKIMQNKNYTKPILVTSAFHMERSVLNFLKQGIAVVPYPTGYMVSRKNDFYLNKLTPKAYALENTSIFLWEYLGILGRKFI